MTIEVECRQRANSGAEYEERKYLYIPIYNLCEMPGNLQVA